MVADVINIVAKRFSVLLALENAADIGLALGSRPKGGGVRQQGL
jgi:hypothetical protein